MVVQAEATDAGKRLDHFLQEKLSQFSRSRLQEWVKDGRVTMDGAVVRKPSVTLRGSEAVEVEPAEPAPLKASPEDLPVAVLYEDEDVIAVNKAAGMVVHAGAGRHSGTLVNALLHKFGALSGVAGELRPGIVHRLDRETSGVLLVAKTDFAHRHLSEQFASRHVEKTYLAMVHGVVKADTGKIDKPITRDPVWRTKMTVRTGTGRTAHTEFKVLRRFEKFTFLEVMIGTGRTHQIRVHLASLGHPIVGDPLYGAPAGTLEGRFFLHAWRIRFDRPSSGERKTLTAELAPELERWMAAL
ncbi:MAG: RluA family pseudouridine synthase [Bryobacteraceae bacterium]